MSEREREFPVEFCVEPVGGAHIASLLQFPPDQIAAYFRAHPEDAKRLLYESYDKRCMPASFILEEGSKFKVGWYSRGYHSVKEFADLADAATDYVLFSYGSGRWNPPPRRLQI